MVVVLKWDLSHLPVRKTFNETMSKVGGGSDADKHWHLPALSRVSSVWNTPRHGGRLRTFHLVSDCSNADSTWTTGTWGFQWRTGRVSRLYRLHSIFSVQFTFPISIQLHGNDRDRAHHRWQSALTWFLLKQVRGSKVTRGGRSLSALLLYLNTRWQRYFSAGSVL